MFCHVIGNGKCINTYPDAQKVVFDDSKSGFLKKGDGIQLKWDMKHNVFPKNTTNGTFQKIEYAYTLDVQNYLNIKGKRLINMLKFRFSKLIVDTL